MVNYRTQMVLHTVDQTAENFVTNTWYFSALGLTELALATTALKTFYSDIQARYSNLIAQTGHELKSYDLADPEPRAPVLEESFAFGGAPSGASLPPEVALCLSFQADKMSGQPQARRRGRVYLGPFPGTDNSAGRPSSACVNDIVAAADDLLTASNASGGDWNWMQHSTMSSGLSLVTNGWVDDEWDTQRRRGRKRTARTVFPP